MIRSVKSLDSLPENLGARLLIVPVSWGDLIDKITILEIKTEQIQDACKLANVRLELSSLFDIYNRESCNLDQQVIDVHKSKLKAINKTLWDAENGIRRCEQKKDFGSNFVRLSRTIYLENDRRSQIKREINLALNSPFLEEKSHDC